MTINYPGPFEIRTLYTSLPAAAPILQHTQKLNIDLVGDPAQGQTFDNYNVVDKDGDTAVQLDTFVEAYLVLFNKLFAATMTIDAVELWKYPVFQSFDAVFWSSYDPVAAAGTGAGVNVPAGQDIYTFRTQEGGVLKLNLMEGIAQAGVPKAYSVLSADQKAVVDFFLDGNGATFSAVLLGRDTSYPFSFIKNYPGQNEGTWKQRNRP